MKKIAILGSTGSIGRQAVEVIAANADHFEVEVLTANSNAALLLEQALALRPNAVVIGDENLFQQLNERLFPEGIKVYCGPEALCQVVQMDTVDVVLTAMVGFAGLKPTIAAIEAGKNIALANKETLVVAGDIITKKALEKGVNIYPVDSEHSAIFQCLVGEFHNKIEKIYLTASGGPFFGYSQTQLEQITVAQALKHPNWNMGSKITIDSATLMNKGLEVIEAKWLFNLKPEQIDVIVHRQSIIHSIVQFEDGSMKAQMGLPDMKLPIQYAMSYPDRYKTSFPRFSFLEYPNLTFDQPDTNVFPNLRMAFEALDKGGNAACILNAANEVAVEAFLNEEISFTAIPKIVETCLAEVDFIANPSVDDYFITDLETRKRATSLKNRTTAI